MFGNSKLRFSKKEYTIGGVISSTLSLISIILIGYSVYVSFSLRGMGGQNVGTLALLAMVISIFGLIFGILSYKEQDKHYGASFFGTFTNGLILVLLILFLMVGLEWK